MGSAARLASFPFVSGDTFRSIASIAIDQESDASLIMRHSDTGDELIIFCSFDAIRGRAVQQALLDARWERGTKTGRKLILHNGDIPPDEGLFRKLSLAGWQIFSPNVTYSFPGFSPIPVGLENAHWNRKGYLQALFSEFDRTRVDSQRTIEHEIFGCFDIRTNHFARSELAKLLDRSRHGYFQPAMKAETYLRHVSRSMFVVSPAGNGLDCHRTWEAIYLGAVPIVLEGQIHTEITSQLPILVLSSWDDIISMTSEALWEQYVSAKAKSTQSAYFLHWVGIVSS